MKNAYLEISRLPLSSAGLVFCLLLSAENAYSEQVASAETLISVDQIVSPYSLNGSLSSKRQEIVNLVVGAATDQLQATCRARNIAIKESSNRQICPNLDYCPDMEIRVFKQSQSMSLD
ncbi:MAG: hypothetical protein M3Q07_07070, partial [Pseudobdellovibrionaceae bacterium]|nr:hypothetical protein [Pseudobdellovibrionaceae bacterium]